MHCSDQCVTLVRVDGALLYNGSLRRGARDKAGRCSTENA
jgi:hypothetical protein